MNLVILQGQGERIIFFIKDDAFIWATNYHQAPPEEVFSSYLQKRQNKNSKFSKKQALKALEGEKDSWDNDRMLQLMFLCDKKFYTFSDAVKYAKENGIKFKNKWSGGLYKLEDQS